MGILALLIIAAAIFLLIFLIRRNKKKKQKAIYQSEQQQTQQEQQSVQLPPEQEQQLQTVQLPPEQEQQQLKTRLSFAANSLRDSFVANSLGDSLVSTMRSMRGGQETVLKHSQIAFNELVIEKDIGTGSYGKVCLGRWNHAPVALKFCRKKENIDDLAREVSIMINLPPHPNVTHCPDTTLRHF
jgi:type II secretory pathway pseudopilin PulG